MLFGCSNTRSGNVRSRLLLFHVFGVVGHIYMYIYRTFLPRVCVCVHYVHITRSTCVCTSETIISTLTAPTLFIYSCPARRVKKKKTTDTHHDVPHISPIPATPTRVLFLSFFFLSVPKTDVCFSSHARDRGRNVFNGIFTKFDTENSPLSPLSRTPINNNASVPSKTKEFDVGNGVLGRGDGF